MMKKGWNHIRPGPALFQNLCLFFFHTLLHIFHCICKLLNILGISQPLLLSQSFQNTDRFLKMHVVSCGGTTCQRDVFSVTVHEHVHFRAVLIIYYNTYCILNISVFHSSRNFFPPTAKTASNNSRMPSTLKFFNVILFFAFLYFSVT